METVILAGSDILSSEESPSAVMEAGIFPAATGARCR